MRKGDYKYKIASSFKDLIFPIILFAVFAGISIWLYRKNSGAFIGTAIFSLLLLALIIVSVYRIIFVKVLIGENSFYHQTAPGNGKSYEYAEIAEAWESSGKGANGTNYHYFNYKTRDGVVHKFHFYPYQYDEVEYLLNKINPEEVTSDEGQMGL